MEREAMEDRMLAVGMAVMACWHDSGTDYRVPAVISRLDSRSLMVRLSQRVAGISRYRRGTEIRFPRYADQTLWSSTFCVRLPERKSR